MCNWGHWVQFRGQMWPRRSFGGRNGLRGHQNGCWMQYGNGYQGNRGCWCHIWGHVTSEVVWRPPWPRRLLEAICTWIPGYSRLLISNLRSYELWGCLEAAMASEAVRVNVHMDTRVIWSQMTSMVILSDILTGVIEVIQHHMPISHSPCRRRYIGPLPSCYNRGKDIKSATGQLERLLCRKLKLDK